MQRREPLFALVTGGAGFIGSHLAEALRTRGIRTRILDNLSTGSRTNLTDGIEFQEGDIRNREAVRQALDGIDTVFHLAAMTSVPRSVENPFAATDVNAHGTFVLLSESVRAKVRRFAYASSSSIYGDAPGLPKRETMGPRPLSPYSASKLAGEIACTSFASSLGLDTIALRFFNVFGPRQDPASPYSAVIPLFLSRLLRDEPLRIYGDGRQTRDFTYVRDVVHGLLQAVTRGKSGGVYNLAGGYPVSLLELAAVAGRIAGRNPKLEFLPPRKGDVRESYADPTRAAEDLGFRTEIGLEEGLQRTLDWLRGSAAV